MKAHNIRYFKNIWVTRSIDLLTNLCFFLESTFIGSLKLQISKSIEYFCWSKENLFFCLMRLFTDELFQPRNHNLNKLTTKLNDHTGAQSHAYIPQRITSNK